MLSLARGQLARRWAAGGIIAGQRIAGRKTERRWAALAVCVLASVGIGGCGETTIPTVTTRGARTLASSAYPAKAPVAHSQAATGATGSTDGSRGQRPSLARMLGQMIVTRFAGTRPSASLLARIKAGRVGGVILFSDNLAAGPSATRALTGELQSAAATGGNLPLLIMTDQEGGTVRRLYWAPPSLSAAAMGSSAIARTQGEATGRALLAAGINLDLAPVADVLRVSGSFLGSRSFSSSSIVVAARACAFADGLTAAGVGFTLKHFPGLGWADASTDTRPVTISTPASTLRGDYGAYRTCGGRPDAVVMVSSAAYPALTSTSLPAVMSPEIYQRELPNAIGGPPLTISDDLQTPAALAVAHPARRAIEAGLDLLMYAQSEAGSSSAYRQLLALAKGIGRGRIAEAYEAIQLYKQLVIGHGSAYPAAQTSNPPVGEEIESPVAPTGNVGTPTTIKASG